MKTLLADAQREILDLRRRNEILSAKVEVMDLFACVLHTTAASRSQGMSEDVAWKLQRKIDELTKEEIDAKEESDNAHKGHSGARVGEGRPARDGG